MRVCKGVLDNEFYLFILCVCGKEPSCYCSSFLWYGWMDAWMATITIDSFTFLFFFLKLNYCNIIFKGHHLCNFGCHNSFNSCKRMPLYYKYIMFYISRNSILWDAKEVICFWSYFFKSIYWHVGTLNCFFFFFPSSTE